MKPEALESLKRPVRHSFAGNPLLDNSSANDFPHSQALPRLIDDTAKALQIDPDELALWLRTALAPEPVAKQILALAKHFMLNPLWGYLQWAHHPENGFDVFLSVDAWITLLHRESSFQGITFNESTELEQGIPRWIECSIYRFGLIYPVTIREYFVELKTDHPIWDSMPRRMMRHKAMQQCARLAFGIHLPEIHCKASPHDPLEIATPPPSPMPMSSKAILRDKLREMPGG
jgi:hypothetical protein